MSLRQVALIGCLGSHQTPRMRTREDFVDLLVDSLGKGDEIHLELDGKSYPIPEGLTPFPATKASHFSIRKIAGPTPKPTTIEIQRGDKWPK